MLETGRAGTKDDVARDVVEAALRLKVKRLLTIMCILLLIIWLVFGLVHFKY